MDITEETLTAALDAYDRECDGQRSESGIRAAILAAAPLIAAQALREDRLRRAAFVVPEGDAPIHSCPESGSAVTPCCGRNPLEMLGHRMTADPALVTCRPEPEARVPKRWCSHGATGHTTECYRWPGSP